jgi:hypothetical protein
MSTEPTPQPQAPEVTPFGPIVEPNTANVFAGPTVLYLAPAHTAPPSLATIPPTSTDWTTAGFAAVGYTSDGVEFSTTPAVKPIVPDEVISPVLQIITDLKFEVKAKLLERHLENLARATAMATLTNPGTGVKTLNVGSGNPLAEYVLGFQGPAPGGPTDRVIIVWRVQVISAVSQHYMRKDAPTLDCTFSALADSTKPSTQDVYQITDFAAGS